MKRKLTSCLLVAGFMLATAPSAFATTYFIKVDGSDDTDGSSWEQAISYDYLPRIWNKGISPMAMSFVLPVECINCPLPISTNI